ncbi:MAG: sigma-70 family RNA polymerase sigma factor [Gammaproteobacteria bacterium]|nr:sigma-70 family RNA polymerase sigma factor [Gammaproteobacteria bacterium]MCZ6855122.1 sigma-70 family RNA polymerase sigma factor [Gammaproteobacteria bacterium]
MSRDESVNELESEAAAYRDNICAAIRRKTGNQELAEDVAQETLLRVINRLRCQGLQDPTKLENFMYRVAANVLREARRKDTRQVADSEYIEDVPSISEDQFEHQSRYEESRLIWQSLEEIRNDGYREILIRFYIRQETKRHICEELNLTRREFTQRIFRAKESLRKLLNQAERGQGLRLAK